MSLDFNRSFAPSKKSLSSFLWITLAVFTVVVWILGISIQQANIQTIDGIDKTVNIFSHFSYNIVFAVVFLALLIAFIAAIIFIIGSFVLHVAIAMLLLLAPLVIPFIVNTATNVSDSISYKPVKARALKQLPPAVSKPETTEQPATPATEVTSKG